MPGLSERIRVVSIIGRFLEHSRLYYFHNGGDEEFFMGSADWMPRNLERRVEVVTPIVDRALHHRLESLMRVYLADSRQGWDLMPDGSYVQRTPAGPESGSHQLLMRDPWGLDRSESRYVTQEFRTAALTGAPEPRQHETPLNANGRRKKSKRNGN